MKVERREEEIKIEIEKESYEDGEEFGEDEV